MARLTYTQRIQAHLQTNLRDVIPELEDVSIQVRMLDGPAGAPRYAAFAEMCTVPTCPYPNGKTINSPCRVLNCPLRFSLRLLLDQQGDVIQATCSGIHWQPTTQK